MDIKQLFKNLFTLKSLKKAGIRSCRPWFNHRGHHRHSVVQFRSSERKKPLLYRQRSLLLSPPTIRQRKKLPRLQQRFPATIASDAHMRFEWIDTSPSLLMQGLDNGHFDAAITTCGQISSTKKNILLRNVSRTWPCPYRPQKLHLHQPQRNRRAHYRH